MIKNNGGHILITSSLVGKFGTPFRSTYAASKHALHGFFEALAAEVWENNIFITLFCGGYIKTNISLNAVKGDGSAQNLMDENQAKGKSAEDAAKAMIKAVEQNKREVYFGGKEILGIYIKRFVPGLFAKVIRKMKIHTQK
jgi:short-subunit dehydrogenase